jgi:iron complex outermembrane receptor protein
MRRLATVFLLIALGPTATGALAAEIELRGEIADHRGHPVADATVRVDGRSTVSDRDGRFTLTVEPGVRPPGVRPPGVRPPGVRPPGTHVLEVTHPAYQTLRREFELEGTPETLTLRLSPIAVPDALTVSAVRADDAAPVTKKDLDAEDLEELHYGQDMPFLLRATPSVTSYSDSGIGNNYSYFSLRGIHMTRINMTLDGVPLNDPAENALYFSNFADFTSFLDSVQIQRGVGTSTVGSPAYGGSIDFESVRLSQEPEGTARIGFGSYGTRRATASYQTGFLDNGLALYGRASVNETDGYRDNSGVEQHTFFFSAAHQGEKSLLKLTSFAGRERSQLAYLAVEPDTLAENPRFNPLDDDETDRFGQDFAQLRYTRALGDHRTLAASIYYNGAQGVFRIWDDPVARQDLLEFRIDGHTVGAMVHLSERHERLSLSYGVHHNDFRRDHFLDVAAVELYRNTGLKRETNAFVKAGYDLGRWHLFGDAQVRHADFRYRGDVDLGAIDWTFFDPKLGVRYRLSDGASVYASIGRASREPTRMDLLLGEDDATVRHDLEAVEPERVVDFEVGFHAAAAGYSFAVNLYAMEFDDEIAATGELSDIGLPLRRNVDRSFRRGLEIDWLWNVSRRFTLTHNSTLSHNRIREWTQFYDIYGPDGSFLGSEPRVHRDVRPLLTPEVIVNQGVAFEDGNWSLALLGRYVGESQLDNTDNPDFRTPSYFQLDFRGALELRGWEAFGKPRISLHVNNLLDRDDIFPSGYSYLFFNRVDGRDSIDGIPFYYPLAPRHFVATLDFEF